jgi:hypothetical protein
MNGAGGEKRAALHEKQKRKLHPSSHLQVVDAGLLVALFHALPQDLCV